MAAAQDTPTAHRARDVAEDLVGRGVPVVGTGLGAKQAAQLPGAILSAGKRSCSQPGPQAGGGTPRPGLSCPSPAALQRGLPGEGGPQPPGGLGHAVAVPHGWRRRRLAERAGGRSGSLGPEPPAPTSRGGAGGVCPVPKHRARVEPPWADRLLPGPSLSVLSPGSWKVRGRLPQPSLPLVKDGPPQPVPGEHAPPDPGLGCLGLELGRQGPLGGIPREHTSCFHLSAHLSHQ